MDNSITCNAYKGKNEDGELNHASSTHRRSFHDDLNDSGNREIRNPGDEEKS